MWVLAATSVTPLLIALGAVVGGGVGALLTWFVRRAPDPEQERLRDEVAQRAARRAVREVIDRLQ